MKRFRVGSPVVMTEDAVSVYGAKYSNVLLEVTDVSTAYMPTKEFYARGRPAGYHPGYDSSAGSALYDLRVFATGKSLPFSLYDYELEDPPARIDNNPSSNPLLRAAERVTALVERGEDPIAGTLRRLARTTDLDKIDGIYLFASMCIKKGGNDWSTVKRAARARLTELGY